MKLSVLMPVYNEEMWLEKIVQRVLSQRVDGITGMEIIIVDDASTDKTNDVISKLVKLHGDKITPVRHQENSGKGSGLKTAIKHMTGDICIIQDADLEYDPKEYPLMLEPIIAGYADCVYGSRFIGSGPKRVLFFWHSVGNSVLTCLSNMFTNLNLTDMETCYKAFRSEIIKSIPLRCERFGFEPEITAKIARKKCRIYEVGISYQGRTYQEGKKIRWTDGVKAIFCIIWFGLLDDRKK
ncbi:MAG: glycosyltransferase family 2 protein [Candidatus Omnitrophica bacterium]|nr:glycosyltransferase family 2 protein [Candidatus Omnitrophota bacterium]